MKGPFWIVLHNDDCNTFNVLGPVSSDAKTTNFTVELQHYGFTVRLEAPPVEKVTKEDLIQQIKQSLGKRLDSKLNWVKDN